MKGLLLTGFLLMHGLVFAQSGVTVSGRVIHDAAQPAATDVNLFTPTDANSIAKVAVAPDGSFEFPSVPPGIYNLTVAPLGFAWISKEITVENKEVTDVRLIPAPPSIPLIGHVTVAGGGPLPYFGLKLSGASGTAHVGIGTGPQVDGRIVARLPAGEYRVAVEGLPDVYRVESLNYGGVDLLQERLKLSEEIKQLSVKFALSSRPSRISIRGLVRGAENLPSSGSPRVVLSGPSLLSELEAPIREDGTFEFSRLLPGTYIVSPRDSTLSKTVTTDKSARNVDFTIVPDRFVSGRMVVENNGPMPRLDLSFTDLAQLPAGYAGIAPDGKFAATLPQGDYRIVIRGFPAVYRVKSISYGTVDLLKDALKIGSGDSSEILVTFELTRPAVRVSGYIPNARNPARPAFGSSALASLTTAFLSLQAKVAVDGSFEFPKVPPGTYTLEAGLSARTTLVVGDKDILGLELELPPPQRFVRGWMVVENGGPLPSFSLSLTRISEPKALFPIELTVAETFGTWITEGEYRVEVNDFPAASHQLKSIMYGSVDLLKEPLIITAANSQDLLDVRIAPSPGAKGVRISGHVRGITENVVLYAKGCSLEARPGSDGAYEFPEVFPGVYSVRANSDRNSSIPKTIVVTDKDIGSLDLVIPALRQIAGRIVVEGGNSIPLLRVSTKEQIVYGYASMSGTAPDGAFAMELSEGDHRLEVSGFPAPYYRVKSIRYGSTDLSKAPLRVGSTNSKQIVVSLAVAASTPWAKVGGHVTGVSLPGYARVVLSGQNTHLILKSAIGNDGSFELPKVLPGTYTVRIEPPVSGFVSPTIVVAGKDRNDVDLVVPAAKQVRLRVVAEGVNPRPGFTLNLKLNGGEGYQILSLPILTMIVARLDFQCPSDTCRPTPLGQSLNEPSVVRGLNANESFVLTLPAGEHRLEVDNVPPTYQLKSLTYGSTDLLKESLIIAADDTGDIVVTFVPR